MDTSNKPSILAVLSALAAGAAFGVGATVSQIFASQGFELSHLTAMQFITATVLLGILVLLKFHHMPSRKAIGLLMVLGVFEVLSSLSYYYACNLLSVGQAVAIQFQFVWITVVIQSVAERKLPNKLTVVAAVFVAVGTLFASGAADDIIGGVTEPINLLGVASALTCAVLYSFFLYFNGRVAIDIHPITRSFFMVVAGAVVSLVPAAGIFSLDGGRIVSIVFPGFVMGVIMLVITCVCLSIAGKSLPGGIVGILASVELPAAVITGCILLGETVTLLKVFGVVVILGSVVLSEAENIQWFAAHSLSKKNAVSREKL